MNNFSNLEIGDDPDWSIPFDFNVACRTKLGPLASHLHHGVIGGLAGYYKLRTSSLNKSYLAVSIILQNLVNALKISRHCLLAVPRDRTFFTETRYRPEVSYKWFIRSIDYLAQTNPPLILVKSAFKDRQTGIGRRTRIKASPYLMLLLKRYSRIDLARDAFDLKGIDKNLNPLQPEQRVRIPTDWLTTVRKIEVIRLKNADGDPREYQDTELTRAMRSRLDVWNEFLAQNFHVGLLLEDSAIERLLRDNDHNASEGRFFYRDDKERPRFIRFDHQRLYRVFNNDSFEQGGRFYGGWWQQIPSELRRYITINDGPTREFDFSNLHAAMLYALEGKPLTEDAYVLPGVDRKLVKTTFFKMMNAYEGQHIDPPRSGSLPPGMSWKEFQEMIIDKHSAIAHRLRSGCGIRMQRIDADIAEDVMLAMMRRGELALPIHDSFITYCGLGPLIMREMQYAYKARMKQEVAIEADTAFFENEDVWLAADEGPEDIVRDRGQSPGYEQYDDRYRAFLRERTDEWHREFGAGHLSGPFEESPEMAEAAVQRADMEGGRIYK